VGQKKIKVIGEKPKPEKKEKEPKKIRVAGLKGGERIKVVDANAEPIKTTEEKTEEEKKKTERKPKVRGKKYKTAKNRVDSNKLYSLPEAIELVKKTSIGKFVGNLEAHIVVRQTGDLGEVKLPYFKAKTKKIAIADEKIVEKIKNGKIDFDILLASPRIMPKLIPFAKVLGPKGLMPNPKSGTLVDDPKKVKAKFAKKTLKIKTEKKAPVAHLVAGKLDQPDKELIANIKALIKTINPNQIKKLVLKATMGPGVKVKV